MTGYSDTPLVKKLGIKQGAEIYVFGAPVGYLKLILPGKTLMKSSGKGR